MDTKIGYKIVLCETVTGGFYRKICRTKEEGCESCVISLIKLKHSTDEKMNSLDSPKTIEMKNGTFLLLVKET